MSLKEDYENGMTFKELAEREECSIPTIRRRLLNEGTTFRPRGRRPAVKQSGSTNVEDERKRVIAEAEESGLVETSEPATENVDSSYHDFLRDRGVDLAQGE